MDFPKRVSILVAFLSITLPIFGQQDYKQFYTIDNLHSNQLIKGIAKDKEGYLWVATDEGVLRYDGYETRVFFKELSAHYTKGFLKKRNGQFYLINDFGVKEIVRINDSIVFKPFSVGSKSYEAQLKYPKAAYEDIDGNLWVGEINAVLRYGKDGLKRFDLGEEFRSIDYHRTFSFAEDAFGNLWIAPFKGPLLFYDKKSQQLQHVSLDYALTDVCGVASVKGDYLMIGGKEGVLKIKIDSDHKILESKMLTDVHDVSILKCINESEVYIGTWTNGLFRYDFTNPTQGFTKLSVPMNDVVDLYFDESKSEFWVAGSESIGLFKTTIVSTIPSAGENRIESMTLDEHNQLYYSVGKQIYFLDNTRNSVSKKILSADDTYFARILLEGTKLWIGDAFGKIFYYDIESGARKYLLNGTFISIQYIYEDNRKNKWFTGHSQGLIKVDSAEHLKFYNALTNSVVVRESEDGKLYCAQNGKQRLLSVYNPLNDSFAELSLTFDFSCADNLVVSDLQFDSLNNIWLGTDEGLLRIDNVNGTYKNVKRVSIAGLDHNEPVRSLAVDNDYVCFANTTGLIIYKEGQYIVFTQESGLPSKILKERGLMFDHQGNLLVATAKGMALVEKNAIEFKRTIRPIFTTLKFNGNTLGTQEISKTLFPYKTKLEAEFISLSFPASNIMYQTRIIGIDKDWSQPSLNRNISVLGFSEGTYTLMVRAREDGKLWSDAVAVKFEIKRPWYRTWWAWLLFGVGGIVVVVIATTIHNNNLIRQKQNLKREVDERTEEIDRQKNELIEQQKKIIQQKEEIIAQNEAVYKSQQALNEADRNYLQLKEKQLQEQIDYKNKQITTHTLNILQKNESLNDLRKQLEEIVKNSNKISIAEIKKTLKTIDESFKLDKDWDDFKLYFEQIHTDFYAKLKISYPDLTPLELRHCALIRLNLTLAECASILGISHDSLKVSRTRLRKKLNLDANQSLTDFILSI